MIKITMSALALFLLSAAAVAQTSDVSVRIQPDITYKQQYGNDYGSSTDSIDVRSVLYIAALSSSYRVTISAQLYDNNFPGTFSNPGEIAITIPGLTPESGGVMEANRLGYVDFSVTGTLSAGDIFINVENRLNARYRWGIRNFRMTLVEPINDNFIDPSIPEPPIQPTPSASIVSASNFCDTRFSDSSVSRTPDIPLTIPQYADQLISQSNGSPSQTDRKKFLDYIRFVERSRGTSYLRQQVGKDGSIGARPLMQLSDQEPGTSYLWCPSSCPAGYSQISIQCDAQTDTGRLGPSLNVFSNGNVCAHKTRDNTIIPDDFTIGLKTTVSCAMDVQPFNYRNVQGTSGWPDEN